MSKERFLTYRGKIRGLVGDGKTLGFVTQLPEGGPASIYRIDTENSELTEQGFPGGAIAVHADGDFLWIAGDDGMIYHSATGESKPKAFKIESVALALLSGDRLASLDGTRVGIYDRKNGNLIQEVAVPIDESDKATTMVADPSGDWLVVGSKKGTVSVFECEGKDEFELSASQKLHEGAVTALLFEPEELRFFSAGADAKLLLTHARGHLEPEDRGRTASHEKAITAMVLAPGERFITGSRDKSLKSWARAGKTKPATWTDGVGQVIALANVEIHNRPHIAAACTDNTLRLFRVDAKTGKITQAGDRFCDAYARAKHEFSQKETPRREKAIDELAGFADARAIELIDTQANADGNHDLRLKAVGILCELDHPKATRALEGHLGHGDEAVRLAAFAGLRKRIGEKELRPIELALATLRLDIGLVAVEALTGLAKTDDRAMTMLVGALDVERREVRLAVLQGLEAVFPNKSAEPNLIALGSSQPDVRRSALIRLFQRDLLGETRVQSAVRRLGEDPDTDTRSTAFMVGLMSQKKLASALRERDPSIERHLSELEKFSFEDQAKPSKKKAAAKKKTAEKKKTQPPKVELSDAELAPLLQSMASRSLDTCLLGGRCLALLGDPRAFGLLLQLSREQFPAARGEVCRALAALDDPRAVKRLCTLLDDETPEVRDAAYSGLAAIHADHPLDAAAAGLDAGHEDVRGRALETLVKAARKSPPKKESAPAWKLMLRALNDGAASIRNEAFKAVLNLGIGGGGAGTLRFALQSSQVNIRGDVLTEVMAKSKEDWAWDLLLELFDDPHADIRKEAFDFAIKKTRAREVAPMKAALACRHPDLRRVAVRKLIALKTAEAQEVLVGAISDEDRDTRLAALAHLVASGAEDRVREAMSSEHSDTRLYAAIARAQTGDPDSHQPLTAIASEEEPEEEERHKDWIERVSKALEGLAILGDPQSAALIFSLLDSEATAIRNAAAAAMPWVAGAKDLPALREALRHQQGQVKFNAALALAFEGDELAKPVLALPAAAEVLPESWRMAAVLALGDQVEDRLMAFLDDGNQATSTLAFRLMLLLELASGEGDLKFGLAALSASRTRTRFDAARAVEAFADPAGYEEFVWSVINDRGEKPAWKIPAETVCEVAAFVSGASPRIAARAVLVLQALATEEQQQGWQLDWAFHRARFAKELAAVKPAEPATRPPLKELQQLVFGAHIGLVRQLDGPLSVRQAAMKKLHALAAAKGSGFAGAVQPVLAQALSDPNGAIRGEAFDYLEDLGMDAELLAAECIESGQKDVGVRGLMLLRGEGKATAAGKKALETAMLTRTDELAIEAGKLLAEQTDYPRVGASALEAVDENMRRKAILWLASAREPAEEKAALKALRSGLESRYEDVRKRAAFELATKKDAAAYDALVALLGSDDRRDQLDANNALRRLGDARTPAALLDRIENDPAGSAHAKELFTAVGMFRDVGVAERVLDMMVANPNWKSSATTALMRISGYDQPVEDDLDDENPDRSWMEKQHPRHDDILAKFAERSLESGPVEIGGGMRWSLSNVIDPVIATLTAHPDEKARHTAIEALAWRVRMRDSDPAPLVKALGHRNPTTKFLAAEGLALVGKDEGLNLLMSSVELLDDLNLRERAVKALGELADDRALELVLRIVSEDGHALQTAAAEAIGHLGKGDKSEEILALLKRFVAGEDDELAANAIRGLRWLDVREGWEIIRAEATNHTGWYTKEAVIESLAYNDDPATRDIFLKLLRGEWEHDIIEAARQAFGEDSLEPDYAALSCGYYSQWDDELNVLSRVVENGDPDKIFELLPHADSEVVDALSQALLKKDKFPTAAAGKALEAEQPSTVGVASYILGRAAAKAPAELPAAIKHWTGEWKRQVDRVRFENDWEAQEVADQIHDSLTQLVWAAGRTGTDPSVLVDVTSANLDERAFDYIRHAALLAIGDVEKKPSKATLDAVAKLLEDNHPTVRALAAAIIAKHDPAGASAAVSAAIGDRLRLGRFAAGGIDFGKTLSDSAGSPHHQPVALPHLIRLGEVKTLASVASDEKLDDSARLGAIEALAAIRSGDAETALVKVAKQKGLDEDLCKAAWSGLRRSKRGREKQEALKA